MYRQRSPALTCAERRGKGRSLSLLDCFHTGFSFLFCNSELVNCDRNKQLTCERSSCRYLLKCQEEWRTFQGFSEVEKNKAKKTILCLFSSVTVSVFRRFASPCVSRWPAGKQLLHSGCFPLQISGMEVTFKKKKKGKGVHLNVNLISAWLNLCGPVFKIARRCRCRSLLLQSG